MKKFLGSWTILEILLLVFSEIAVVACFIFAQEKNVLSFAVSVVGVLATWVLAKGLTIAPIVNMCYGILYSILAILQHYYGEAIVYLAFVIPTIIFSIIAWLKHRNNQNNVVVQVNKIKGKEYALLGVAVVFALVGFYFLLKSLNTSELILSTFSLVSSAVAWYLMFRRSAFYAIGFMVNETILIILWSMAVVNSGVGYLPMVICSCVFLISEIYGFIHWKITEKKQQAEVEIS